MLLIEGAASKVPEIATGLIILHAQALGGLTRFNRQFVKLQEKGTPLIRPERSRKLQIGTSGTRRRNRYRK